MEIWKSCANYVYYEYTGWIHDKQVYFGIKYFSMLYILCPGYYFSGDGARRTKDGYYQITGRMDDVLNISGHRLGTAEIEDVLVYNLFSNHIVN